MTDQTFRLYIDGEFCDSASGSWFDDINPATGETIARVAEGGAEDVDRAALAAKRAMNGPWAAMSVDERCDILESVAEGIEDRADAFLAAEVADTGKPASFASRIDIPRGAANFRFFANFVRNHGSESFKMATGDGRGALTYVIREPIGVVGVISPWNLPLLLLTWKLGPALAAGNAVVVKPSEETPATATLLAEVFDDVGVPPGVYNLVHGFGPDSAGEAISRHDDVDAITFTGESSTGGAIMRAAAGNMKSLSFELGGKNPAIIFEDADLDEAVAGTMRSVFANCGQVCLNSERVYVERPIFDEFVARLKREVEATQIGDPMDDATGMGPLISATHREKVLSYYELAEQEGAEVVVGGGVPELDAPHASGFFVEPTIWTGLSENARVVKEEIFGPCCHIAPFDDEDHVVAMANDTQYGLCAAVWTQDLRRGHRMAERLEAGMIWLNTWFLRDLRTPFGGLKLSGIGREGGKYSMDFYSELKTVMLKM